MEDWQGQVIKHPFASRVHCGKLPERLGCQVTRQTGEPISLHGLNYMRHYLWFSGVRVCSSKLLCLLLIKILEKTDCVFSPTPRLDSFTLCRFSVIESLDISPSHLSLL